MNKEERAIKSFVRIVYANTGYNHSTVLRALYCLITNKVNKNDLLALFTTSMPMEPDLLETLKQSGKEKNWILFTKKYYDAMEIEGFPSTQSVIEGDTDLYNIVVKDGEEFVGKIPLKKIYFVVKRLAKRRQDGYFGKHILQNPPKNNTMSLKEYRELFIRSTQWTQENHRKQSQRYTVSRDEDRMVYYTSMEGRLAKMPCYKFRKYVKSGQASWDGERRANAVFTDGIFVKIGRYIEKNYPKWPMETKEMLQKAFEEIKPCHMVIDRDFKKAYDPIYNNHQDTDGDKASNYSCMSGRGDSAQEFYGGIHGCSVVRFETDDGKQVGRCIMYEYKGQRHFIRIYGEYDYHRTMINMLQNEMKENDLFGRGKAIDGLDLETDWTDETPCMYLDGGEYGYIRDWRDDTEHYRVVAYNYDNDCKTTSEGTLGEDEDEYYTCDCCGHRVHQDDAYYVGDYVYCSCSCAHESGWYECDRCGEWTNEEDGFWADEDHFYCDDDCARADGWERCEHCGEWHDKDDMIEPTGGTYYCDDECAEADGWRICDNCDDWVHEDDAIEIDDKLYCSEYCAEQAGYVKVGEEWKRAEDEEEVKETEEPKEVVNEG